MANTFDRVRSNIIKLLQDMDYKVIALTGKWGTGKTFLWESISDQVFKETNKKPIFVTLFGARSVNDLKLRIIQNAYLNDESNLKKVIKAGSTLGAKWFESFVGPNFIDVTALWLPKLVSERLIVIDDIERKHKDLDIDEFLGLLDEYSKMSGCRFLILANIKQLNDAEEMWKVMHEKVIDAEVVLEPSSFDSFDVASQGNESSYLAEAREAVGKIGVTNIRVIKCILKTIDQVAEIIGGKKISLHPWVPSTALMVTSHFRGIEDAPTLEYIKSCNTYTSLLREEKENQDPKEVKWDSLLRSLGISSADEYEEIIQEYLTSGFLDNQRLIELFGKYEKEEAHGDISSQIRSFLDLVWWNPKLSETDLLSKARDFLSATRMMTTGDITSMVDIIEDLGDAGLARQFLDAWVETADSRPEFQQLEERTFDSPGRKIHPEIVHKLESMRNKQHPPLSLLQTSERIANGSGWGERERISLGSSTPQQYKETIEDIKGDLLRTFLVVHLERISQIGDDPDFKKGMENFYAACKEIYSSAPESRLSKMVSRTFKQYNKLEMLSPSPEEGATQAN
jgi:hypothetical protein